MTHHCVSSTTSTSSRRIFSDETARILKSMTQSNFCPANSRVSTEWFSSSMFRASFRASILWTSKECSSCSLIECFVASCLVDWTLAAGCRVKQIDRDDGNGTICWIDLNVPYLSARLTSASEYFVIAAAVVVVNEHWFFQTPFLYFHAIVYIPLCLLCFLRWRRMKDASVFQFEFWYSAPCRPWHVIRICDFLIFLISIICCCDLGDCYEFCWFYLILQ